MDARTVRTENNDFLARKRILFKHVQGIHLMVLFDDEFCTRGKVSELKIIARV